MTWPKRQLLAMVCIALVESACAMSLFLMADAERSPDESTTARPTLIELVGAPPMPRASESGPKSLPSVTAERAAVETTASPAATPSATGPTLAERLQVRESVLRLTFLSSWRRDLAGSRAVVAIVERNGDKEDVTFLGGSLEERVAEIDDLGGMVFLINTDSLASAIRSHAGLPSTSGAEVRVIVPGRVWATVEATAIELARRDGIPLGAGTTITVELSTGGRLRVADIRRA